jgi:hypothetical protein
LIEFTAYHSLISGFDLSFCKGYDRLVRKGNAEPPIRDFSLQTRDGADSTEAIMNRPGYTLLYLSLDKAKDSEFNGANQPGELTRRR